MKLILLLLLTVVFQYVNGQDCNGTPPSVPTIGANRSTNLCEGSSVILSANPGDDNWVQKANFPGAARADAITFTIGNKGYLGLGRSYTYPYDKYRDFWEYDPLGDIWTQKADFPGLDREGAVSFSVGGKGYVGTGIKTSGSDPTVLMKDFWAYDPLTDQWTRKADFAGAPRYAAAAFSIAEKAYVGTGISAHDEYNNDLWEYNTLTDTWLQRASMEGLGRASAAGLNIDNKGYIGMGTRIIAPYTAGYLIDFWLYDPSSDSWAQQADYAGKPFFSLVSFSINEKGYVGSTDLLTAGFWQYDPAFNTWIQKEPVPGGNRTRATTFSINGKGYVAAGLGNSGVRKDVWEYNPGANYTYKWSTGETTSSIFVNASGSYTVEIKNSEGCISTSAPTGVTVGANFPEPLIDTDGPTSFCEGKTVLLSVAGVPPDFAYHWSTGETTTSIQVAQSGNYSVTLTSPDGCSRTSSAVTIEVTQGLPTPIIWGGPSVICEGESTYLLAAPGPDGNNPDDFTYLWSTLEMSRDILVSSTGVYTVTLMDANGCTATSLPFYTYLEPRPTFTYVYMPPDCSGANNGSISIIPSGYTWEYGYTIDNWETYSRVTTTDLPAGTYYLGIVCEHGCRSLVSEITLAPFPRLPLETTCPAPLALVANNGCNAADVQLQSPLTTGGCEPITITSSHAGGSFPVGKTIVTWTATDSYGQVATCGQVVTVTDQTPPTLVCPSDMIVQATSSNGAVVRFSTPAVSDNCPGSIVKQISGPVSGAVFPPGETKVTFQATDASNNLATCSFTVRVTSPNPYCGGTPKSRKVYVCHKGETICVNENALAAHLAHGDQAGQCGTTLLKQAVQAPVAGITVFPNPATRTFNVQLKNIAPGDGSLLIMDVKGSILETRTIQKGSFVNTIRVDMGNRAKGAYMVRFVTASGAYNTWIVVE